MNTLENIKNDLQYLFCITKNRKIEELFLKADNQSGTLLLKDMFDIIGHIPPPNIHSETFMALQTLLRVHESLGGIGANYHTVSQYFLKSGNEAFAHYPMFKVFYELLNEGKFTELLMPFKAILDVSQNMQITDPSSKQPIPPPVSNFDTENDIKSLLQSMETLRNRSTDRLYEDIGELMPRKKQTKREKIESITSSLIKEFSVELSDAARNIGMNRLADELANGSLINPIRTLKALNIPKDFGHLVDDSKRTTSIIITNLDSRTSSEQYNFVRNRAMVHGKAITFQQYQQYYIAQMEQKYSFPMKTTHEPQRMDFTPNQLVNPDALMFISFVLYGLAQKIK